MSHSPWHAAPGRRTGGGRQHVAGQPGTKPFPQQGPGTALLPPAPRKSCRYSDFPASDVPWSENADEPWAEKRDPWLTARPEAPRDSDPAVLLLVGAETRCQGARVWVWNWKVMNVTGPGRPEGPRRASAPSRPVSWALGPGARWVSINEVNRERRLPERFLSLPRPPRPPPRVLCSSGPSVRVCEGARPGQMLSQASSEGHVSGRRSRPGDLRFLWSELPTLGLSCGFWS